MAFGSSGAKPISGRKNSSIEEFEKIAAAELNMEEAAPAPAKKEDDTKKPKQAASKAEKDSAQPKKKEDEKKEKATKTAGRKNDYYKQYYNMRIDLPKEAEPFIELASQLYGTRKDYIIKLILDDMEANAEEYRQRVAEKKKHKWDF